MVRIQTAACSDQVDDVCSALLTHSFVSETLRSIDGCASRDDDDVNSFAFCFDRNQIIQSASDAMLELDHVHHARQSSIG